MFTNNFLTIAHATRTYFFIIFIKQFLIGGDFFKMFFSLTEKYFPHICSYRFVEGMEVQSYFYLVHLDSLLPGVFFFR